MWESAKTVAPTPNSAIVQLDVDDNFVINSTHLKMIRENKFDGYLRADPHDISTNSSQSATCSDMVKLKAMDSQVISLNEELQDIRNKYNEFIEGNASKNHMNDDTSMCERHEANYIHSKGHQNRIYHDSFSRQSHHDVNDFVKSRTELNSDVRNDLKDFKRCVRSMTTIHDKLYDRDDSKTTGVLPNEESKTVNQKPQSKTDLEISIIKFLDG
nr:hypothetical protein [Tanacetum cinerariifolium]